MTDLVSAFCVSSGYESPFLPEKEKQNEEELVQKY